MHPVFNHVAPYRYLLTKVYLSVADIANPDLLACAIHPAFRIWPDCPKNVNRAPIERSTQFHSSTACMLCRFELEHHFTLPITLIIIISKYLFSAKFTNKCALMRCLIKYIVIHCVQHIYIYINTHTYICIHTHNIYTMMVVNIKKHITVIWLALRWYMILNICNY